MAESESVREELGYTDPNPETTKRIIEHLNPSQPETGKPDPERDLPTVEEAEYGKLGIADARSKIRKMPDDPSSPSSR